MVVGDAVPNDVVEVEVGRDIKERKIINRVWGREEREPRAWGGACELDDEIEKRSSVGAVRESKGGDVLVVMVG